MTAAGPWLRWALAATLALVATWSLLPVSVWLAGWQMSYLEVSWQIWTWGSLLALLVTLLLVVISRGRVARLLRAAWRAVVGLPRGVFVVSVCTALAALAVFGSLALFDGNPRNVDGFAQLFQARIFLAGRAWIEPPPELANFAVLQMVLEPGRWYSQYPPGQPLVLAAGLALGAWWLLNPLMAAGLAFATYRVARWVSTESVARLAALLMCMSPFVVAMAGSEMSHLGAAALGMGAAAMATATGGRRGAAAALATGALLGLMTALRPLDATAAALPVLVIVLLAARKRVARLAQVIATGTAFTLPTLWFNRLTTGSWLEFGYTRLWGPQHSLGFHDTPWGTPLTPLRAVGLTSVDLHQLNAYLFDAPFPILAVVAIAFLAGRARIDARDAVPLAGAGAVFGLLFFYWHRDVYYGPRLHFSAVPWVLILVARSAHLLAGIDARLRRITLGDASVVGLVALFVIGLVWLSPLRLKAYRETTPIFHLHPDRDALRAGISNAVVVVPDGWGSRLIVRMWEQGVPWWRSTRLYSAIDACALERALGRAEEDGAARAVLVSTLEELASRRRPGARAGITPDPNLRLPERLSPPATIGVVPEGGLTLPADSVLAPECVAEIRRDQTGFLSYGPLLYLNTARFDGDVVWARDLGPRNAPLFARYEGRTFYRYAPLEPGGTPVFTRLETPAADAR